MSNQRNVIIIVVIVVIVLCCCCLGGIAAWWLWNNGDALLRDMGVTGQVLPLALMMV